MNKKRTWLICLRKSQGLTQTKVAKLIGVTQQMYGCIENGKRCPSVTIAQRIGKVLGFEWTKFYE